jgi:polysaccharide transporter, PST family
LYTLGNAFLLGLFAGPTVVAYFAGPEKISRALYGLLNPVRETLYPRISKLVHTSPDQAARLARIGITVSGIGGLILGGFVFAFAPMLIKVVLGAQFAPAVTVLRLLAALPPIISVMQSVGMQWLLPLGRERAVTRTILVAGLLNIALVFLLVPAYQQIGMAWAVLCSEIFVCLSVLYLAMTDREYRMPFRRRVEILPELS